MIPGPINPACLSRRVSEGSVVIVGELGANVHVHVHTLF